MRHIDTLEKYEQLLKSGVPETQAKAQVYALNSAIEESMVEVATKQDLQNLEAHLKIYFNKIVGGAVVAGLIMPIFLKILKVV